MACNFFVSAVALCKSDEYFGMFRFGTALFKHSWGSVGTAVKDIGLSGSQVQAPEPPSCCFWALEQSSAPEMLNHG